MRPWILLVLVALSLAGCEKDTDTTTGLVGSWQLVNRQCYCARTPLPNESVVFTTMDFSFFTNGQLTTHGTYALATAPLCGSPAPVPALRFTHSSVSLSHTAGFTVDGTTLVLDYGGPCDGPVDTYQRVR